MTEQSQQYGEHFPRLLPFDVRYALEHRGAQLGVEEIEVLHNSGLARFAFGQTLKSLDGDFDGQSGLLQDALSLSSSLDDVPFSTLQPYLDEMHGRTASAEKLRQISTFGFQNWVDMFRDHLHDFKDKEIYVVSYAPLSVLDAIIESTMDGSRTVHLLMPNAIEQGSEQVGVTVVAESGVQISALRRDFVSSPEAVIVEDVVHSGRTLATVENLWYETGDLPPEVIAMVDVSNTEGSLAGH